MPRHPFYNSKGWKVLRALKLKQNPICEICLCAAASEVDHIIAINAGGSRTASSNLRSCCHECHSQKTFYIDRLKWDRVPVKGCDINGRPLDPEHYWNKTGNDKGQAEIVRPDALQRERKLAVSEAKDRGAVQRDTYFGLKHGS